MLMLKYQAALGELRDVAQECAKCRGFKGVWAPKSSFLYRNLVVFNILHHARV